MNGSIRLFLLGIAMWATGLSALNGAVASVSTYEVHGVLRRFDPASHQASIAHDAIPDYMPAMTMDFDVRDMDAVAVLQPGDSLAFQLSVSNDSAWIDHVRKISGPVRPAFIPAAAVQSPARELSAGEPVPDQLFTDAAGEPLRLRDLQGQAVALTFIYTRCPLPTYCPLMNHNFQTAQALLARLGAGENWRFLSVSLDPAHDTAGVLAGMQNAYRADTRHWTFVTAPEAGLHRFGAAFGLEFDLSKTGVNHNLRTVVIDAAGGVKRIFEGNAWTPQELAAEMRSAMRAPKSAIRTVATN